MKKYAVLFVVGMCTFFIFFSASNSHTNSTGAPSGFSGSISDGQNNCSSCHISTAQNLPSNTQVIISSELENGDQYTLGASYYISITASSSGINKFGFQACMENTAGEKVGQLVLSETVRTQLVGNGDYITHTAFGAEASGISTWLFVWNAPLVPKGDLTLHTSVLFSNNNNLVSGDEVIYTTLSLNAPEYGCTNSQAFNFDAANTIEDGTCFFSQSSAVLSLSYTSLDVTGFTGEELILPINVHNNSDEDLVVNVERHLILPGTPYNWFCWDLCYASSVSQSINGIDISSEHYTDDFSAHMLAATPGNYAIEYCFYTEGALEDSICATVNYNVAGEVYGCLNPNAFNYNSLANVEDSSCITFPQPIWSFSEPTSNNHIVAVNSNTPVLLNNAPIAIGDWIGVFYEADEGYVCAGYTEWLGENTTISVTGFDAELGQGFPDGEAFIWQVWDASAGVSWPMSVTYSLLQNDQGSFQNNGFSSVTSMTNIQPINGQLFDLPSGWSFISSYIATSEMSVDQFFSPIYEDLVIVKNNSGASYIAAYNYNSIGLLIPGQGYQIKVNNTATFSTEGDYLKPALFPIALLGGWNLVGYLPKESLDAELIFQELIDQDLIVIVKDYHGNTLIPEFGFNGIGLMNPGEAYRLKTTDSCILQY